MSRLKWDKKGERLYQRGLDRGVLYPNTGPGVPWNGLISVDEKAVNGDPIPRYHDGHKYYDDLPILEYEATLTAYTYPDAFSGMDGYLYTSSGLGYGQQQRTTFGLSYRTAIGNDLQGDDYGYEINLIYNASATPTGRTLNSYQETPELDALSWKIVSTPENTKEYLPVSHIVLSTRRLRSDIIDYLEDILYGTQETDPRLPTPDELEYITNEWYGFQIFPQRYRGVAELRVEGHDDLTGDTNKGYFTTTKTTRLREQEPGIYRLDN